MVRCWPRRSWRPVTASERKLSGVATNNQGLRALNVKSQKNDWLISTIESTKQVKYSCKFRKASKELLTALWAFRSYPSVSLQRRLWITSSRDLLEAIANRNHFFRTLLHYLLSLSSRLAKWAEVTFRPPQLLKMVS